MQRYSGIHPGWNKFRRYGDVYSPGTTTYNNMRSNLALFFEYIKNFKKFGDVNAIDVSIKADQNVPVGFINDILEICGLNSIPNVSFIFKERIIMEKLDDRK